MACPFAGKYAPAPEPPSDLVGRKMRMLSLQDTTKDDGNAVVEAQIPVPRPDEVLMRVFTAGVGMVAGSDIAGIVQMVGHGVKTVKPGDRVFGCMRQSHCQYAEYVVVNPEDLFPLPEEVGFSQGAAIGSPYFTAYRALINKACCRPGDVVVINNATGDVGVALCQIGCLLGMRVIMATSTQAQQQAALRIGAEAAFNVAEEEEQFKAYMRTRTVNMVKTVIECSPHKDGCLERDVNLLSGSGSIIVVTSRDHQMTLSPQSLVQTEAVVMGCNFQHSTKDEHREAGAAICNGVRLGVIHPAIKDEFPMAEAAEARRAVISPDYKAWGSVIITV